MNDQAINGASQGTWADGVQAAAEECKKRGRAIVLQADKAGDPQECERLVTVGFHFWRCGAHIEKLLSPAAGQLGHRDMSEKPYGEVLDEMDHQAKYQPATISTCREEELRIQAVGAAISRRDWLAVERAYEAIRDEFDRRSEGQGS